MTVLVDVNTAKQIGDAEHIKVFTSIDAAETTSSPSWMVWCTFR
jgi:hypothetical protein